MESVSENGNKLEKYYQNIFQENVFKAADSTRVTKVNNFWQVTSVLM